MNDPNRNDDDDTDDRDSDKGNQLLEEFRQQWKRELKPNESVADTTSSNVDYESSQKIDEDKVTILGN